jgi:hypothetical protein
VSIGPRNAISRSWILVCSAGLLLSLPASAGKLEFAPSPQASKPAAADARKDYALIYGTVWGADDHPVAGVPISIRRASDKKPKWELVSDNRGEFAQRVPVGEQDYIIQANIKAPKGQPKPEVTVHIDNDERRDVSIRLSK